MVLTGEIHPLGEGTPSLGRTAQRQPEVEQMKEGFADHGQTVTLGSN